MDDCWWFEEEVEDRFGDRFNNFNRLTTNKEIWEALDGMEKMVEYIEDNYEENCPTDREFDLLEHRVSVAYRVFDDCREIRAEVFERFRHARDYLSKLGSSPETIRRDLRDSGADFDPRFPRGLPPNIKGLRNLMDDMEKVEGFLEGGYEKYCG